jgi:uncharacterized membrane protein
MSSFFKSPSGSYNKLAGQSAERIASLSDGVFAFAMTLLVLDLRIPIAGAVHSEAGLRQALASLEPNLLTYFLSFMTLGMFWVGEHTQLSRIKHAERGLTWIHLAFLLMVTLVPFSTKLLSAFITYRTALVIYWLNLLGLGATLYWSWEYVRKANLLTQETSEDIFVLARGRVFIAQGLYVVAMLFCFVDNYLSIALIILIQLNYVFAPPLGILRRF